MITNFYEVRFMLCFRLITKNMYEAKEFSTFLFTDEETGTTLPSWLIMEIHAFIECI